jgi:hypothetical protein
MNPLFPIITAGAMYIQPIVPQTYYIANLSETDGAKCGEYISVTPQFTQQPEYRVIPQVILPSISLDDTEE